jgi:pentatricopeptide repeat protein
MATTRLPKPGAAPASGEERIKELRSQVSRDPFNINLRFMLAAALETAGRYDEAVKLLADTVEKARRNLGVAYSTLAKNLIKVKKPDEALTLFDRAIEVDPVQATFYLSLKASALRDLGLQDRANAIFQELLRRRDLAKETRRIVIQNLDELKK